MGLPVAAKLLGSSACSAITGEQSLPRLEIWSSRYKESGV